ncbi:monoacylglycerol lipase ABHD2-like [Haliotis rufescens]|uniref:monoacylglycerol lipase ABHD2-like n=1 Tax=Haliotis rufescens TaxID=6454 RepID=UPI00201F650C|nr:monoacylglycerol lipase ABHD2-like [Haliotis rufescens]
MTELLLLFLCAVLVLCVVISVRGGPVPPVLYYRKSSQFVAGLLTACPIFLQPYTPTRLWGRSGHVQTIVYSKIERLYHPNLDGRRHERVLPDGATSTFDVYEVAREHPSGGDYSMLVCPGIANSSENPYIRTFADAAVRGGYRVAVLNHLGVLADQKLTSPRVFDYGSTQEFHHMVEDMRKIYPNSSFLAVGFSMGANIITKYLGEHPDHQKHFICGMSLCQGYDIASFNKCLERSALMRLYNNTIAKNVKTLLRRHRDVLFSSEAERRYGKTDVDQVFNSASLFDLAKTFSCRRAGFEDPDEYYTWGSSATYLDNITIPMLFLNTLDDPVVSPSVHGIARKFAETHDNCLFVVTRHGGHLGFYEGGFFVPSHVTWLERAALEYAGAVVTLISRER